VAAPLPVRASEFRRLDKLRPSVGPLLAPVRWWAMTSVLHDDSVLPRERISSTSSPVQPAMALSTRVVRGPR